MKIDKIKIVCFSPTGTSKLIAQTIAQGIQYKQTELIDITKPTARMHSISILENELLITAVPVYMGRVPDLITEFLRTLKGKKSPTIAVVVYGNRAYDNALLELKDILVSCGCNIIAGAAFIAEHSFSSEKFPSSPGRPDAEDIIKAKTFGNKINELLRNLDAKPNVDELKLPGSFPYGGVTKMWDVDFIAVSESCTSCSLCAKNCPAGAIDAENSSNIDIQKCTLCCACIKNCPQQAKSMKPGLMYDAAIRCTKFTERKEPECFFSNSSD